MDKSVPLRHQSTLAEHPDVREVLPRFIARLPGRVAQLRELLATDDQKELQRLVHQLRGAGKSYGFAEMSDLAAAAEESVLADQGPEAVTGAVQALIGYLECVEGYGK